MDHTHVTVAADLSHLKGLIPFFHELSLNGAKLECLKPPSVYKAFLLLVCSFMGSYIWWAVEES